MTDGVKWCVEGATRGFRNGYLTLSSTIRVDESVQDKEKVVRLNNLNPVGSKMVRLGVSLEPR